MVFVPAAWGVECSVDSRQPLPPSDLRKKRKREVKNFWLALKYIVSLVWAATPIDSEWVVNLILQ